MKSVIGCCEFYDLSQVTHRLVTCEISSIWFSKDPKEKEREREREREREKERFMCIDLFVCVQKVLWFVD
jgi:hypothetical protein